MQIVVVPYLLSSGLQQAQQELPFLVAEAQQDLPGVKCVIAEPIGMDGLLAEFVEHRVKPFDAVGPQVSERDWNPDTLQPRARLEAQAPRAVHAQQARHQLPGKAPAAPEFNSVNVAQRVQWWEKQSSGTAEEAGAAEHASASASGWAAEVVAEPVHAVQDAHAVHNAHAVHAMHAMGSSALVVEAELGHAGQTSSLAEVMEDAVEVVPAEEVSLAMEATADAQQAQQAVSLEQKLGAGASSFFVCYFCCKLLLPGVYLWVGGVWGGWEGGCGWVGGWGGGGASRRVAFPQGRHVNVI